MSTGLDVLTEGLYAGVGVTALTDGFWAVDGIVSVGTDRIKLYELLPYVIRLNDYLASGSGAIGEIDPNLRRIVWALEQETDITLEDIDGLKDLVDIDNCSAAYLSFLGYLIGASNFGEWSTIKKKNFIKAVSYLWHISGQRRAWQYLLNQNGYPGYMPWELWKTVAYETVNYSSEIDYTHTIKAARIALSTAAAYSPLAEGISKELMQLLKDVQPIHVQLVPTLDPGYAASDTLNVVTDVFTYIPQFSPEDTSSEITDLLEISTTCVSWCESQCESVCQSFCESTCQAGSCETGCELFCENNCQLTCEYIVQ